MGAPFTSTAISGYNTNPPPSDGTTTEANRVEWDTIKTKLPDPIKTAFEASEAATLAAFGRVVGGNGVSATAISYQVLSTDQGKIISATAASITVTSPDATDVGSPFVFGIHNTSGGDITFDGSGSQTVDGAASITLAAGEGVLVFTDGSNWLTLGRGSAVRATNSGFAMINGALSATVGSSALTIAIKTNDGSDPSASNPVYVVIRDVTASTGTFTLKAITAATSLVISSGSTLGTSNGVAFRLWLLGFNDAGTFRLAAINCRNGNNITGISPWSIGSATAEGGAGAADNAQNVYAGAAVSSKSYQILGYMTWESGLATAGAWNALPTRIQLYGLGVPVPGQMVATVNATSATQTDTTSSTFQNTNVAATIGLSSAANLIRYTGNGQVRTSNSATAGIIQVHRGATAIGVMVGIGLTGAGNAPGALIGYDFPGTTSNTTYTIKVKSSDNANTVSFPYTASPFNSGDGGAIILEEIMA